MEGMAAIGGSTFTSHGSLKARISHSYLILVPMGHPYARPVFHDISYIDIPFHISIWVYPKMEDDYSKSGLSTFPCIDEQGWIGPGSSP